MTGVELGGRLDGDDISGCRTANILSPFLAPNCSLRPMLIGTNDIPGTGLRRPIPIPEAYLGTCSGGIAASVGERKNRIGPIILCILLIYLSVCSVSPGRQAVWNQGI